MSADLVPTRTTIDEVIDLGQTHRAGKGLEEEQESLRKARSVMLPVEKKAADKLDKRLSELKTLLQQKEMHGQTHLPLDPLKWRWPNGLPKLAPVPLSSPMFTISASRSRNGTFGTAIGEYLPAEVTQCYHDVQKKVSDECFRNGSACSVSFEFDGVIPPATRIAIGEAIQSKRFESIFMLVEVPENAWVVRKDKGINPFRHLMYALQDKSSAFADTIRDKWEDVKNIDPVVVGWYADKMWVIDRFDVTTLEQYVLDEFGQRALLP